MRMMRQKKRRPPSRQIRRTKYAEKANVRAESRAPKYPASGKCRLGFRRSSNTVFGRAGRKFESTCRLSLFSSANKGFLLFGSKALASPSVKSNVWAQTLVCTRNLRTAMNK